MQSVTVDSRRPCQPFIAPSTPRAELRHQALEAARLAGLVSSGLLDRTVASAAYIATLAQ